MAYPYGAALTSFLGAYDQAERRRSSEQANELSSLLHLQQLGELERKRREEEDVFSGLAQEIAARREQPAMAPDIQMTPTLPPIGGESLMSGLGRAETEIGPSVSGAPMLPNLQARPAFGASLPPEQAARVLAHPRAQVAIQNIKEAEQQQETQRLREEGKQLFDVAAEKFRGADAAGGYEELAKAYHRMGQPQLGARALEHAVDLRQDEDENKKAESDLKRITGCEQKFREDPSTKTHADFLECLNKAESKGVRALRLSLAQNQLKSAIGRDPFSAIFWKKLDEKYADAWGKGESPTFSDVLKQVQTESPGLLLRVIGDEAEKSKLFLKEILTGVFKLGDEVDPTKLKDFTAQAIQLFRSKTGRSPQSTDEWAGVFTQANTLAKAHQEAIGRPEEDKLRAEQLREARELRITIDSLKRQRKDATGAETEDLNDRIAQKERDLKHIETQMRGVTTPPGRVPLLPPETPAPSTQTPAAKLLRSRPYKALEPSEQAAVLFDVMRKFGKLDPTLTPDTAVQKFGGLKPEIQQAIIQEILRIRGKVKAPEATE